MLYVLSLAMLYTYIYIHIRNIKTNLVHQSYSITYKIYKYIHMFSLIYKHEMTTVGHIQIFTTERQLRVTYMTVDVGLYIYIYVYIPYTHTIYKIVGGVGGGHLPSPDKC